MLFGHLTSHSDNHNDDYEAQGGKAPEGWVGGEKGGQ